MAYLGSKKEQIEFASMKDIERLLVEFFSAVDAQVEFEGAEWIMQSNGPISLTSLAIEIAKLHPPQANADE